MARRVLNRKDLRADYDAAERRKGEEVERDEEEEEAGDEEEAEAGEEVAEGEDEEEEEEAPKKKKPVAKPKAKPRSRAAKVVRLKAVWGVFNNSNQRVAVYEYPKRKEADDHATRLTTEKKNTHFVQLVKEPIEERKEA